MTAHTLIPPLLTPLLADEQIDRDGIRRLIDHVVGQGATGVFVLGSSGEGPLLTREQRQIVVETASAAVHDRVPLFVGVSECSVSRVREQIHLLDSPAVTAFVLTVPFYGDFSDAATQIAFFKAIADMSPRPIMLYNIPSAVHSTIEPETVAQLAAHPNIMGMKDSAGDLIRFQRLLQLSDLHDFMVLQGAEQLAGLSLLAGADGLVAGMANLVPHWFVALSAAARERNIEQVVAIQARINDLWTLHTAGHWLSSLKAAASLLNLCAPTVSAPLPMLSRAAVAQIQAILVNHALITPQSLVLEKEVDPIPL